MNAFPKTQAELESMLFGSGHCTRCGKDVDKLVMVKMPKVPIDDVPDEMLGLADTDQDGNYYALDVQMPRKGLCEACAVAKYAHNKH